MIKFIDKISIFIKAGDGGNGFINFFKKNNKYYNIKNKSNGGDGGNIYLQANKKINDLNFFLLKKNFYGQQGEHGKDRGRTGKNGINTIIQVPIGTIVHDLNTKKFLGNLKKHKQNLIIARGGKHGIGTTFNHLKQNNILKKNKKNGKKGEEREIQLELNLTTDIGIFGFPNTGKSTFIHKISTSKPKIDYYPFTTIIPNLSIFKNDNYNNNYKIIEIPGLIKNSNNEVGLGIKYLKHLNKCKVLLHFVDIQISHNEKIIENITTINNILETHNKNLKNKTCWLIFNKIDQIAKKKLIKQTQHIIAKLKWDKKFYLISSLYNTGIRKLYKDLQIFLNKET